MRLPFYAFIHWDASLSVADKVALLNCVKATNDSLIKNIDEKNSNSCTNALLKTVRIGAK